MAIGLGWMTGFRYPQNFNYPYIANSITDFWQRWHMSLSRWFRDYLYIPMGGNRLGNLITYRNLFVVFILCGLWHGAAWTFLIWGVYHGVFLVLERMGLSALLEKLPRLLRHAYTLIVVIVGWVFFRSESLPQSLTLLGKMFLLDGTPDAPPCRLSATSGWSRSLQPSSCPCRLSPGSWLTCGAADGDSDARTAPAAHTPLRWPGLMPVAAGLHEDHDEVPLARSSISDSDSQWSIYLYVAGVRWS
ncbi:MAG: MBOAT family protein [Uliginosibacterium sp.]|nr:MBOAT family protein [Uliginosibacterium sp.]